MTPKTDPESKKSLKTLIDIIKIRLLIFMKIFLPLKIKPGSTHLAIVGQGGFLLFQISFSACKVYIFVDFRV